MESGSARGGLTGLRADFPEPQRFKSLKGTLVALDVYILRMRTLRSWETRAPRCL